MLKTTCRSTSSITNPSFISVNSNIASSVKQSTVHTGSPATTSDIIILNDPNNGTGATEKSPIFYNHHDQQARPEPDYKTSVRSCAAEVNNPPVIVRLKIPASLQPIGVIRHQTNCHSMRCFSLYNSFYPNSEPLTHIHHPSSLNPYNNRAKAHHHQTDIEQQSKDIDKKITNDCVPEPKADSLKAANNNHNNNNNNNNKRTKKNKKRKPLTGEFSTVTVPGETLEERRDLETNQSKSTQNIERNVAEDRQESVLFCTQESIQVDTNSFSAQAPNSTTVDSNQPKVACYEAIIQTKEQSQQSQQQQQQQQERQEFHAVCGLCNSSWERECCCVYNTVQTALVSESSNNTKKAGSGCNSSATKSKNKRNSRRRANSISISNITTELNNTGDNVCGTDDGGGLSVQLTATNRTNTNEIVPTVTKTNNNNTNSNTVDNNNININNYSNSIINNNNHNNYINKNKPSLPGTGPNFVSAIRILSVTNRFCQPNGHPVHDNGNKIIQLHGNRQTTHQLDQQQQAQQQTQHKYHQQSQQQQQQQQQITSTSIIENQQKQQQQHHQHCQEVPQNDLSFIKSCSQVPCQLSAQRQPNKHSPASQVPQSPSKATITPTTTIVTTTITTRPVAVSESGVSPVPVKLSRASIDSSVNINTPFSDLSVSRDPSTTYSQHHSQQQQQQQQQQYPRPNGSVQARPESMPLVNVEMLPYSYGVGLETVTESSTSSVTAATVAVSAADRTSYNTTVSGSDDNACSLSQTSQPPTGTSTVSVTESVYYKDDSSVSDRYPIMPPFENSLEPVSSFSNTLPSEPSRLLYAQSARLPYMNDKVKENGIGNIDSAMLLALKQCSIGCERNSSESVSTLQSYGSTSSTPSNSTSPPPMFLFSRSSDSVIYPEFEYDSAEDGTEYEPLQRWIDTRLTQTLFSAYHRFKQTPVILEQKRQLQRNITDCLAASFGLNRPFKLFMTGSSATGLGTYNSDMDLCMIIYDARSGQIDDRYSYRFEAANILQEIQTVLTGNGLAFHAKVINSNPPILKFIDKHSFEVNLNINKFVTIQNTLLLQRVCALDSRIRPFLFSAKLWALKNGINCAYLKSLSSYSISLLSIFVLQNVCGIIPKNLQPIIDDVNNTSQYLIHGTHVRDEYSESKQKEWIRLAENSHELLEVTSSVEYFVSPTLYDLQNNAGIETLLACQPSSLSEAYHFQTQLQAYLNYLRQGLEQVKALGGGYQLECIFLNAGFYTTAYEPIRERTAAIKLWRDKAKLFIKKIENRIRFLEHNIVQFQCVPIGTDLSSNIVQTPALPIMLPILSVPQPLPEMIAAPPSSDEYHESCSEDFNHDHYIPDSGPSVQLSGNPFSQPSSSVLAANHSQGHYQSLGALFYEFMNFYSTPDVFNDVLCVRIGEPMTRYCQRFSCSPDSAMITHICVEEPFNATNTTHSVHHDYMFMFIKKAFRDTRKDILEMRFNMDRYLL